MDARPLHFISEQIEVIFKLAPVLEKKTGCPDGFTWRAKEYKIIALLGEWHDYRRRGNMARNMRPEHAASAGRRGSWGVGQDYYRIHTDTGQVFDIYYDRAPKGSDERKGVWFLYQELDPSSVISNNQKAQSK
jgi:hypothetical protein